MIYKVIQGSGFLGLGCLKSDDRDFMIPSGGLLLPALWGCRIRDEVLGGGSLVVRPCTLKPEILNPKTLKPQNPKSLNPKSLNPKAVRVLLAVLNPLLLTTAAVQDE